MLPVSNDTLLSVVRQRARVPSEPLRVIGIDDFAGGAIVCDLERRRPVVLLPDRETATSEAWLRHQQPAYTVAGDRGGGYGEAVTRALPQAIQVADRWHLIVNASRAFLDAVRKSMRQIRAVIGATVVDLALPTAAEHCNMTDIWGERDENDRPRALEGGRADQTDRSLHGPSPPDRQAGRPWRAERRLPTSPKILGRASPLA